MDQTVVDVGDLPVAPGDVATLFGPGTNGEPTITEWARWAGTIEHEVLTGIGARVARVAGDASPGTRFPAARTGPTSRPPSVRFARVG
jgi:alanine racemase